MSAGNRIRLLREACALRQEHVAQAVGKSRAWLSRIENGHFEPTLGDIRAIEIAIRSLHKKLIERLEVQLTRHQEAIPA